MPATATSPAPAPKAASHFSEAERNALILQYYPIIRSMARAYSRQFQNLATTDDLANGGVLAFISALDHFNPALGKSVWSYAACRVYGSFRDYYRDQRSRPRESADACKLIQVATHRLQGQLSRVPTHEEIAAELGLDLQAFYELYNELSSYDLCSLSTFNDSSAVGFVVLCPVAPTPTPYAITLRHELKAKIGKTLSSLDHQHQDVFRMHYEQQLSARVIAKRLGISARTADRLLEESVTQLTAAINPSRAARRVSARRAQAVPTTASYSTPALAYSFC